MVMPGWINDCVYCLTWRWASAACLWSFQTSSQIVSFAFLSSGVWRQIAERLKIMSTPLSQINFFFQIIRYFYNNYMFRILWTYISVCFGYSCSAPCGNTPFAKISLIGTVGGSVCCFFFFRFLFRFFLAPPVPSVVASPSPPSPSSPSSFCSPSAFTSALSASASH